MVELATIERKLAAITKGPWSDVRVGKRGDGGPRSHEEQICNADGVAVVILTHDGSVEGIANADFIQADHPDVAVFL